ncbi:MAG: glycogen/starch synthase [Saprospiraceae bacterium]
MSKKKVLIVTQEMDPYTDFSHISAAVRKMAPYVQENDMEIRVLMPRFGTINERRHRLHEVVRLSGMNIIVDDDDYPLIIKVASLSEARMQVYFLDNEDFFKRKHVFKDDDGQVFDDNADRMVFFCKGALETVKKFGWAPDIIHCHGWMTSMIPLYLHTAYKNEPLFEQAKIVYSVYQSEDYGQFFNDSFAAKASINNLTEGDLHAYQNGTGVTLEAGVMQYADAVIRGEEVLPAAVEELLANYDKPVLSCADDNLPSVIDFYQSLLTEDVEG